MGKLKNKLIDEQDQKLTIVYVVVKSDWDFSENMHAFKTYEKALDYCSFMNELYADKDYTFDVESLDLEE